MNNNRSIPLIGITAMSGTGKTTLLEKLIPELKARGISVGVIKHSHHSKASIDHEGKDTWRMSQAGASQVALVTQKAWTMVTNFVTELSLLELASQFDPKLTDLILVEGFKHEPMPKILLHRQALLNEPADKHTTKQRNENLLLNLDQYTIAVACDYSIELKGSVLDINSPPQIADFIVQYLNNLTN